MVLLRYFIPIAILALSHSVIANEWVHGFNKQFENWDNPGGNIARIHHVPSDELLGYGQVPVLPARPLQPRIVFDGEDNRKDLDSDEYPYNLIRKISLDKVFCSGTAVGPRHFLTARHCLPDDPVPIKMESNNGQYPVSYATDIVIVKFRPTTDHPSPLDPTAMLCYMVEDFAVLVFDKPIFESDGYFGAKLYDEKDTFKPIYNHAGFNSITGTVKGMHQDNVRVTTYARCGRSLQLGADADVDGGQSGGPLYKMDNGYAMQIGTLSTQDQRLGGMFCSGVNLVGCVAYARDMFP
ncbi:hypothetical protein FPOAC2_02634 [Fusarium poae]